MSLFQCLKSIFKLTTSETDFGHNYKSFSHLRVHKFLIPRSSLFDNFLALRIIILAKRQLAKLISDIENLRRRFVFCMIE